MARLPQIFCTIMFLAAAATPICAQEPLTRNVVSVAQAEVMIDGAVKKAKERGVEVSIVVVDPNGGIIAAHRMDGSGPVYFEIARRKALTSAVFRTESRNIEDNVVNGINGSGSFMGAIVLDNIMPRQGALPVKLGEATIGAIGVSGTKPEVDEVISQAGIDALSSD